MGPGEEAGRGEAGEDSRERGKGREDGPHTRRGVGKQDEHGAVGGGGFGWRPILGDESTKGDMEDEIEWIHNTLIDILSQHPKVVTISARCKRWWSDTIRVKRRTLGLAVR